MNNSIRTLVLGLSVPLVFVVVLPGCSFHRVAVKSVAYSDYAALPAGFKWNMSFRLDGVSIVDGVKQEVDELAVKELQKKISIMLRNHGYRVTDSAAADYCLRFNFGCKQSTETQHTFKYVPGQTVKTNTTVIGTSGINNYDQTTTAPGKLVCVPEHYSVYTKFLEFRVYNHKGWEQFIKNEKAPSPHVWYGKASSTSLDPDVRSTADYLLVSLFKMFGRNGTLSESIAGDNKAIKGLRAEMMYHEEQDE